jgi:hypothetical protein
MDLTYREKRIWINLVTQLFVYAVYFVGLWHGKVNLGSAVVAIVVLQIVLQIGLAVTDRPSPKDERDIAIERIAYRNAYFVLAWAIAGCMALLTVHVLDPGFRPDLAPGPFAIVNVLLFLLLLAELGKLLSQLVLYRRTA